MYSRKIKNMLKRKKIEVGDVIKVKKDDKVFSGILMPRINMGDQDSLVIKLENGYNVGLKYSAGVDVNLVRKRDKKLKKVQKDVKHTKDKLNVSILSMGGTIASRVDYKTGGVFPHSTAEELVSSIPELAEIANIHGRQIRNILSEDMEFSYYIELIKEIKKDVENGFDGIIVTHGTDTMHYTASAVSFALENLPIPVIFVGSQRSSDRASSDGPMNVICAAQFITKSDFGEVAICMHATESDDLCNILPACKSRKMHTSCRNAFSPVNASPWAIVSTEGEIKFFRKNYRKRDKKKKMVVKDKFEKKVALLKSHVNMNPKIIDALTKEGFKGIVLEGTGLGHVPVYVQKSVEKFLKKGIVVMTSQCINGRVNMNVYSRGRELEKMGVIPGKDMLPETAYIKLCWLLGNYKKKEVLDMIGQNLRGEINERSEF